MRADLHITPGLIRRRYDQGLDSIVRLVNDLEDRIEDVVGLHVTKPQSTIRAQAKEIKRLSQAFDNKAAELVEAHQINRQLQTRIRELEKSLESDTVQMPVKRDSHNSNQPPSLDLP